MMTLLQVFSWLALRNSSLISKLSLIRVTLRVMTDRAKSAIRSGAMRVRETSKLIATMM